MRLRYTLLILAVLIAFFPVQPATGRDAIPSTPIKEIGNHTDTVQTSPLLMDVQRPSGPLSRARLAADEVEFSGVGPGAWTAIHDATVSGNYVVCAMKQGLLIVDNTDPANPFEASSVEIYTGNGRGVTVSGNYAYLADDVAGLQIVDISDPSAAALVASETVPGAAYDVAVYAGYAYVSVYSEVANGTIQVFDVADPTAPVWTGSFTSSGFYADGIDVEGSYAYLTDGNLQIVDVSDPTNPAPAGVFPAGDRIQGVTVRGDYAYVSDGEAGFKIIDVTNPLAPTLAGAASLGDIAYGTAVTENLAFVAYRDSGIAIYDVTTPTSPVFVELISTPQETDRVAAIGPVGVGISRSVGFTTIDASDTAAVTVLGSYQFSGAPLQLSSSLGCAVKGNYLFHARGTEGLTVIDITDPEHQQIVTTLPVPGYLRTAEFDGDYLYIPAWDGGLQIVDASDPTAPVLSGGTLLPNFGLALDVAVAGTYAYVTDFENSFLHVIDVSDPGNPSTIVSVPMPSNTSGVDRAGDYLYVACMAAGLQVMDISNPTLPTNVGSLPTADASREVVVRGDYAYVADGVGGLHIADVTDPTTPAWVGQLPSSGYAFVVRLLDDYAMIADRWNGVTAINVFDPTNPQFAGGHLTPDEAYGLAIHDRYMFVSDPSVIATYRLSFPNLVYGDVNNDGETNVVDVIFLVQYAFKGGERPHPVWLSGDVNCNDTINVVDIVTLINYVFRGGPQPTCP